MNYKPKIKYKLAAVIMTAALLFCLSVSAFAVTPEENGAGVRLCGIVEKRFAACG